MSFLLSSKHTRVAKLSTACVLAAICLFFSTTLRGNFSAVLVAQAQAPNAQAKQKTKETNDGAANGTPVLWREPTDLERRDLFYGLGGRKGAPDPAGRIFFIADKGSPQDSNPKIEVKDELSRNWTVKFGPEAKSETAATRIVWAMGYHVDQDYFVKEAKIEGYTRRPTVEMRFEREDDDTEKVGRWKWDDNPFVGTREFDGLKTLMALLNNVDLTENNNRIVRFKGGGAKAEQLIYYVNDLGASLGSTGAWVTSLPFLDRLATETKGKPEDFAKRGFISGVKHGTVDFRITRRQAEQVVKGVKAAHARWIGEWLSRLSDKQLTDAFTASGFSDFQVALYVREIRARIAQLLSLDTTLAAPGDGK